ncbi:hypothetical protein F6Q07_22170 [Pectobacterium parmentieri]|uniref:hypothetical protein n=1 Tax=Pectobacterium parmentieri TaxID=1905730 RepID=UPI0018E01339|nr:hypothetical protein [Pectobacterium parmentieri]MBI0520785.1 hypothetical protein [Pectobacterium parmentieri]
MKERPIIFNEYQVRALLSGDMTQVRRIVKPQPDFDEARKMMGPNEGPLSVVAIDNFAGLGVRYGAAMAYVLPNSFCPFGQPGDHLYVRESFSRLDSFNFFDPAVPYEVPDFWYWADGEPAWGDWTRPQSGAVMPRDASRLKLEVTGVRVERLRNSDDMTLLGELGDMLDDCDSVAGRAFNHAEHYAIAGVNVGMMPEMHGFKAWWDKVNGYGSFDASPWVWVIEFKRIEATT